MKHLTEALAHFIPPLWLVLALAAVAAAALLAAFIDTLQENVRHGEEVRRWQRVGAVRQPIGTVNTAATSAQSPQLALSISPTFQR